MSSRGEETRTHLLNISSKIFAERGYQSTTHQEISSQAEVNISSVNYHFGSKEGLYIAVWEYLYSQVQNQHKSMDSKMTPQKRVCSHIEEILDAILDSGERGLFERLIHHEMRSPSPMHATLFNTYIEPKHTSLQQAIASLLKVETDHHAVTVAIHMIISPAVTLIHHAHHPNQAGRPLKQTKNKVKRDRPHGPPPEIINPQDPTALVTQMQQYALGGLRTLARSIATTAKGTP
jgi:AcrR family transcriptional regulator